MALKANVPWLTDVVWAVTPHVLSMVCKATERRWMSLATAMKDALKLEIVAQITKLFALLKVKLFQ